jgi:hypothetical protein
VNRVSDRVMLDEAACLQASMATCSSLLSVNHLHSWATATCGEGPTPDDFSDTCWPQHAATMQYSKCSSETYPEGVQSPCRRSTACVTWDSHNALQSRHACTLGQGATVRLEVYFMQSCQVFCHSNGGRMWCTQAPSYSCRLPCTAAFVGWAQPHLSWYDATSRLPTTPSPQAVLA